MLFVSVVSMECSGMSGSPGLKGVRHVSQKVFYKMVKREQLYVIEQEITEGTQGFRKLDWNKYARWIRDGRDQSEKNQLSTPAIITSLDWCGSNGKGEEGRS